ncbi:MAG: hypothetical protein HY200_04395 [Nitrospirae bacterium]|nr:hypothetical protein [Nitrospirota bacterium]MBI3594175.1 hypothetical protein [Nitrospirota bacterium]
MLKRIKDDSELGVRIVKKGVSDLIQRSLDETEVIRTRFEIRKKEKEFDGHSLRVGKMLFERLQKGENPLDDPDLKRLLSKATEVRDDLESLRTELAERLHPMT